MQLVIFSVKKGVQEAERGHIARVREGECGGMILTASQGLPEAGTANNNGIYPVESAANASAGGTGMLLALNNTACMQTHTQLFKIDVLYTQGTHI